MTGRYRYIIFTQVIYIHCGKLRKYRQVKAQG